MADAVLSENKLPAIIIWSERAKFPRNEDSDIPTPNVHWLLAYYDRLGVVDAEEDDDEYGGEDVWPWLREGVVYVRRPETFLRDRFHYNPRTKSWQK